ncbi:unnamed protein product [Scytosiphon promiscuus]
MILIVLLGLSALLGALAASPCLDTNDTEYSCQLDASGQLSLADCEITDDDGESGDLAACFDAAGREDTTYLSLYMNALTTLPSDIFRNFTALETLSVGLNNLTAGVFEGLSALTTLGLNHNRLTTLPEGVFEDLSALTTLQLRDNTLSTLPSNIFKNITALETLGLSSNNLTALPEGVFEDLSALTTLDLFSNALTTLPEGAFQNCTALETLTLFSNNLNILPEDTFANLTAVATLYLNSNALTTLPRNIFQNLTALETLRLDGNSLECLPETTLEEVDDDATIEEVGLHVDTYGDECGCVILDVTDNVCGEETCTPGSTGYTCATTSTASTPAPSFNTSSTTEPATTQEEPQSASNSVAVAAGVVCAIVAVALVALAVLLRRRRASKQKGAHPPVVRPADDDDTFERGRVEPRDVQPPSYETALALRNAGNKPPLHHHNASRHRHTPAEADAVNDGGIATPSAPEVFGGRRQLSAEGAEKDDQDCGAGLAGVAHFSQRQSVGGGSGSVEASGGGSGASLSADSRTSFADIPDRPARDLGLRKAVLAAAQELAQHCQTPGISEAATAVCIVTNLVTDNRDNNKASESRLRQCHSLILVLERAAKVADKREGTIGAAARVLIEEVYAAIVDLTDLIRTFQSKNKLSKAFMSTLFKRRLEELDAVVDRAILRLQLDLQLQVWHDASEGKGGAHAVEGDVKAVEDGVSVVKGDVGAVKSSADAAEDDAKAVTNGVSLVKEAVQLHKGCSAEAKSESVAEARRMRRRRKLDQVEIPEDHLFITGDLLGKGGFGEVYLADYNGHNAAAKVLTFAHGSGALEENQEQRGRSQRRAFLRELETMIRLRSPNTVNVYGAVMSFPDRMVLVMELLVGGDLLTLLRKSTELLPEEQSRRIVGDICTGMSFLHSKNTIHGDLKSANVLLDGDGRAKIADFGTSRWSQHSNSTGLATYTTRPSQNIQMTIAWSAPEVLDSGGSTYESDVYSFGIVVWEVFSRERPWGNKTSLTEILTAVLKGSRPPFREDAPADIVEIAEACWSAEPKERTSFRAIMESMKA